MLPYNRQKYLRLVERARQAHVTVLDLSERLNEAKAAETRMLRGIGAANRSGSVDVLGVEKLTSRLHGMTADELESLDCEEAGVNPGSIAAIAEAKREAKRIAAEYEQAEERWRHHKAIEQRLTNWLQESGFGSGNPPTRRNTHAASESNGDSAAAGLSDWIGGNI